MRTKRLSASFLLAVTLSVASQAAAAPAMPSCATPTGERLSKPPHGLLDGAVRRGVQPEGEPVLGPAAAYVIYFGAAWCGPCRLQVRAMKALYRQGDPERLGYQVVFASKDISAAAAAAYVKAESMPWPYLEPGASGPAREVVALGGRSAPDMVVVDDQGRVLCRAYDANGRYLGVSEVLQALRLALARRRPHGAD